MALGIELQGTTARGLSEDPLGTVERLLAERIPEARVSRLGNADGQPTLFASIHPASEDVRLSLTESGDIVFSASTSAAGPGYHVCLVEEVLDALSGTLGVRWQPLPDGAGDETGYFEQRDLGALEDEMLSWVHALARHVTEETSLEQLLVALDLDAGYTMPGFTPTSLGPRERPFWKRIATVPRAGTAFFPWWTPGRRGAEYWLNRALVLIWTEVRWIAPVQDGERRTLEAVRDALSAAHADDPGLAYPWQAWDEVLALLETPDELVGAQARSSPPGSPLGYLRYPVRASLTGRWSLLIPGSMHQRWKDDGKTFCAWDDRRTVWFSSFAFSGAGAKSAEQLRKERQPGALESFELDDDGRVGIAELRTAVEDGAQFLKLSCKTSVSGGLAITTVCFEDRADLDWALGVWRSLRQAGRA